MEVMMQLGFCLTSEVRQRLTQIFQAALAAALIMPSVQARCFDGSERIGAWNMPALA